MRMPSFPATAPFYAFGSVRHDVCSPKTNANLNFMRQNGLWQAPVEREEKFVKVAEARHGL